MNRTFFALTLTVFSFCVTANADELLLKLDYSVRANRSYQTKFFRVNGYPRNLNLIRIATRGDYCKLQLSGVEFLAYQGDYAREATFSGLPGVYNIPGGVLRSINIKFRQTTYRKANCQILVYRPDW